MTERPIIFSGPMVRAILDGRKTQTRRIIKNPERLNGLMLAGEEPEWCPYGGPGDLLYVREGFCPNYFDDHSPGYKADFTESTKQFVPEPKWKPSIHMPKKYARIWLKVEAVRVERVQEISESDARAEGPPPNWCGPLVIKDAMWSPDDDGFLEQPEDLPPEDDYYFCDGVTAFKSLWDSINKKRGFGWDENPWVWIVSFSVISTIGRKEVSL